jgi:hypothetical protein
MYNTDGEKEKINRYITYQMMCQENKKANIKSDTGTENNRLINQNDIHKSVTGRRNIFFSSALDIVSSALETVLSGAS